MVEQVWKLEWKPLVGIVVLLPGRDGSIVVDRMGWVAEDGHGFQEGTGAALTKSAYGSSLLVLVHGLWPGAAGPAWLVLEGRQSRLLSLISKLHRLVSAFVL